MNESINPNEKTQGIYTEEFLLDEMIKTTRWSRLDINRLISDLEDDRHVDVDIHGLNHIASELYFKAQNFIITHEGKEEDEISNMEVIKTIPKIIISNYDGDERDHLVEEFKNWMAEYEV